MGRARLRSESGEADRRQRRASGHLHGRVRHRALRDRSPVRFRLCRRGGRPPQFVPAPGADPDNPSVAGDARQDFRRNLGSRLRRLPSAAADYAEPQPVRLRSGRSNFAYPWLFSYPQRRRHRLFRGNRHHGDADGGRAGDLHVDAVRGEVSAIWARSICRPRGNTGRTTSTIRESSTTIRRRGSTSVSW